MRGVQPSAVRNGAMYALLSSRFAATLLNCLMTTLPAHSIRQDHQSSRKNDDRRKPDLQMPYGFSHLPEVAHAQRSVVVGHRRLVFL
jgi:hypothetical protein